MTAKVESACLIGTEAYDVQVEVSLAKGLPCLSIVGLPDASVREARDRVIAAIRNTGFELPARRFTVNLAPAEVRKEGASFDLAMALGILLATDLLFPKVWPRAVWLGELALDGRLRPVRGALALVRRLSERGVKRFVLPEANRSEVAFLPGLTLIPLQTLKDATAWLSGEAPMPEPLRPVPWNPGAQVAPVDMAEIKGQRLAKRALEIAAAGNHNLAMVGCPGTGKSMLAQALPSILPDWSLEEALEATQVHSLLGVPGQSKMLVTRPFRSPHHTTSPAALVGGGDIPQPGEISLAHRGVLFLDELPEFRRDALEALRQPLEEGVVHVHRARGRAAFPAEFLLVTAMNPCPCGHRGHPKKECICSTQRVHRYRGKISAPLMDRVDLHVELPVLKTEELLSDKASAESSEQIRARVRAARKRQANRQDRDGIPIWNSRLRGRFLAEICPLDSACQQLLGAAVERLGLSARAFDRIRRVARTIADLESEQAISAKHLAEAIQFRLLDRPALPSY
jgi:magnesium chelatase family protein